MKRLKFITTIILIIFALVLLNQLGVVSILQRILSPIQSYTYSAGLKIKSIFQIESKQELVEENQILKEKLEQLTIDKVSMELLKQENELLKRELNFLENSEYKYQIVKIISRETFLGKNALVLNKGSKDGIELGQPIILSSAERNQGYLIGKIIQVDDSISMAALITDPKSLIAAKTIGLNNAIGLVRGERGLTLKMDLIPSNKQIETGDLIVSSGLEEKIPEGLIIGEIEEIISSPGDFFNEAKIRSFVDFDNLKVVTVLLQ